MSAGNEKYHSRFGGLWIDQLDTNAVAQRIAAIPDPVLRDQITRFERDGFVILERAVPHAAINRYLAEYARATAIPGRVLMTAQGAGRAPYDTTAARIPGSKVLGTAMLMASGDDLAFAAPISAVLRTLFDEPALAHQSLHFEVGSTQTIHQDTAYVVIDDEPIRLAASWIALEDVFIGSGELEYYVGGHRMRDHPYDNGKSKHFAADRDAPELHTAHIRYLRDEAARLGLKRSTFIARKGDALIWHADLPHGGSKITRPGVTRASLVTHYCPSSLTPHYFPTLPPARREKVLMPSGNRMASWHYNPADFGTIGMLAPHSA